MWRSSGHQRSDLNLHAQAMSIFAPYPGSEGLTSQAQRRSFPGPARSSLDGTAVAGIILGCKISDLMRE